MLALIAKIARARSGATAVEYALIASLISIAAVVGMELAGPSIAALFEFTNSELIKGAKANNLL